MNNFYYALKASSLIHPHVIKNKMLIGSVLIICISCFSPIEIKPPNDSQFLVVNAINFQSDSTWLIEVSRNKPFASENAHQFIDNAEVYIEDEDNLKIQLQQKIINSKTYYYSNHKPEVNKQYKLTVHTPGFISVNAVSKIPSIDSVIPLKIKIDSTYLKEVLEILKNDPSYPVDFSKSVSCNISFIDPPAEKNFYDLRLFYGSENSSALLKYEEIAFLDLNGVKTNYLTDDIMFNGTTHTLYFNIPIALFLIEKISKISVSLRLLSPEYYNYLHTANLQQSLNEDPFAQPVIVYSNVEHGAGIFAGFNYYGWILDRLSVVNENP